MTNLSTIFLFPFPLKYKTLQSVEAFLKDGNKNIVLSPIAYATQSNKKVLWVVT